MPAEDQAEDQGEETAAGVDLKVAEQPPNGTESPWMSSVQRKAELEAAANS